MLERFTPRKRTAGMKKNDSTTGRLVIWTIIVVSVIGTIYFGYRAILEDTRHAADNPFEYDIERYMTVDPALLRYSETNVIPAPVEDVSGIALGNDNSIAVTGGGSVVILNPDGTVRITISTGETANCIHIADNGDIYLGMNDHIEVYDNGGVFKAEWESLGVSALITSIVSSKGFVFAADAGHKVVVKYDKQGNKLLNIGKKDDRRDITGFIIPSRFFDLDIDPDGFLWAVNTGRHSLENYTFNGDFRSSWGENSMRIEDFCGCCNPTHIAITDDGKFVTSEKGIPRVKIYNRIGELESVVAGPDQFAEKTQGLDLAIGKGGTVYVLDPVKKVVRIFKRNEPEV